MSLLSCLSALRAHTIFAKWLFPSTKTSGLTRKGEDCLNRFTNMKDRGRSQFGNAGNFGRGGVLRDDWQAWCRMTMMAVETTVLFLNRYRSPPESGQPLKMRLFWNIPANTAFDRRSYFRRLFSPLNFDWRTIAHVGQLQRFVSHLPERCFSFGKPKNLGNHPRGGQF
ncbi:hypothetical protein CN163_24210 [Sinorhizobium meliloti]|nr:hypothetical protein CN163_24210 [Sinorhizobium meliloti]